MKSVEDYPKTILLEAEQHSVFLITLDSEGKLQLACAIPEDATEHEMRIFNFLRTTFFPEKIPLGIEVFEIIDEKLSSLIPANKLKI